MFKVIGTANFFYRTELTWWGAEGRSVSEALVDGSGLSGDRRGIRRMDVWKV